MKSLYGVMYWEERKKICCGKSPAWPLKAITLLIEICWTNIICWSAFQFFHKWEIRLWQTLLHQTFVSPSLFWKDNLWKECTRPRRFVAYFRRAAVLQRGTPNGTCTGDPFAFPALIRRAAGTHLPVLRRLKQAGGKVHGSALTRFDSVSVMGVSFLRLFKGQ